MRRVRLSPVASFVAGSLVALWVLMAVPSDAHPASSFYRERWVNNKNVPYSFTPGAVPTSEWRARTVAAAGTWTALGEPMKFVNVADSPRNFSPSRCPRTYQKNGIHRRAYDGVGGVLARTFLCTRNGQLWSFQLSFDKGDRWYTGTGSPAANQADLQSVAAHELGHATGFAGHFSLSSALCADNATQHTMCAGHRVGTNRQRTLEEHDVDTFRDAY